MANLQVRQPFGLASSFVGLAKSRADVIAVSELTAEEVQEFSRVGIEEPFPHSLLKPAPGAGGIGLWSRYPLVTVPPAKHPGSAIASAQVQIPNVRFSPLVASVHITSPVTAEAGSFDRWRNGIADIQTNLGHFAEKAGPAAVIIAGDFNSTPDVRQIRDLLANGYRDAVEQTGRASPRRSRPTNGSHRACYRPHVLTRNAAASSIQTVDIPGSDHRKLLATVEVPLNPEPSRGRGSQPPTESLPFRDIKFFVSTSA
ncbi:endonuclease/exonuclease/phosphatase family protein [Mycolicibacterium elephantis]|uniref:endonuclease/exonuclease/phosphatase family protein n=1 Tax=Mycolicibacterium elephantis TaxID=81858 RepID=UPI000A64C245|nr:endonuclease/exonuclease/phosphatase family protein [Mycolicibacterium elephantis]